MIAFLLIPAFLTAFSWAELVHSNEICSIVFTSFMCICRNREDFQLGNIIDEDINKITIKGCRTVIVQFGAFGSLQLEELEFSDIDDLQFSAFTMSPIRGAKTLRLENISNMNIQPHAFVNSNNVANISLINVTIHTLETEAFSSASNIQYLLIYKSNFHQVKPLAFQLEKVTVLHVIDSRFDSLYNNSIVISDFEEVQFENCSFSKMRESAFYMSKVNSVSFQGCTFESLTSKFIEMSDVQNFNFSMCTIDSIKVQAFEGVQVKEKITFANNTIQIAYPGSLDPFISPGHNYSVEYCCNYFNCDCNMYWIWDSQTISNATILKNSFCSEDGTKDLSLYTPIIDSYNNCISLEITTISGMNNVDIIYKKLKLNEKSHAPVQTLSIVLYIILCGFMITQFASNVLIFL